MGQTLTNGIFLPNEGERNCYEGLAGNWRAIDGYFGDYNVHVADAVIHVSQADRDKWDDVENKADSSALTAHTGNTTIHVTAADKTKWDTVTGKADDADVVHKEGASSLSMPADSYVDISAYVTNLAGGNNQYTAPGNGWIYVDSNTTISSVIINNTRGYSTGFIFNVQLGRQRNTLPVCKDDSILINVNCTSLNAVRFIPCQGNV